MLDQKQQMSAALDKSAVKKSMETIVQKHPTNSQSKYVEIGKLALKVFSLITECEEADGDALMLIANAVEAKVRFILQRMLTIAGHRMQPLELNPLYRKLDDPLSQVKFMEEIEMRQFTRKRKSAGVSSDVQISRRKEQESNRKANEAAQAALGGKSKFSYSGVNNPLLHGISGGVSLQTHRPKVKVLTMRDVQYVLGSVIVFKNYFYRANQAAAREHG